MRPKVICAFAGLGKTTISKKYKNIYDLQSSPYRYDYTNINKKDYEKMKLDDSRIPDPNWPNNYLCALKELMEKYDLVLVPSNPDVRELLVNNKIDFLFVLPSYNYRDILFERYKRRGNNITMINSAMNDFDTYSRNQNDYEYPITILDENQSLEDLLIEFGYIK